MTVLSRPFLYSLLIHLCLFGVFLFAFMHDSKEVPKKVLKLNMISLSMPALHSLPQKPILAQPKEEIKSTPINKPTPLLPVQAIQKAPLTPTPAAQTTPIAASQPISRPSMTPQATPSAPPVEIPKPVHTAVAPSVNLEKEFLDAHLGEIRALLVQNLRYPRNAQRLRMQGEVRVSFRLKSDGSVENIEVVQSSGFELLDEDAKALIKNTAPQFPKPTKTINLSVPLAYLLR